MTTRRQKIQKVLDATSQEVATLGLAERREMLIALRQAEVELSTGLNEWLKKVPDGAERFTAVKMRSALASTRQALRTIRSLNPKLAGQLETARAAAAGMAIKHSEFQLLQFESVFDGEIKPPNYNVARIISKGDRLLLKKFPRSAKRYGQDMIRHIKRQLVVGVVKGETIDQTTSRLTRLGPSSRFNDGSDEATKMARGLMQLPRSQVSRIIRTESINAYNVYHIESLHDLNEENPEDEFLKRWDATLDRRNAKCTVCPPLDGQVRKLDEMFEVNGQEFERPTAHPHCFLPDTEMQGVFIGGLKVPYSGKVIELTVQSGCRLTVTPNHPVLTDRGWIPAGDLCEGDDLFSDGGRIDGTLVRSVYKKNGPTPIKEIFSSLREAGSSSSVTPSARHLHGDARGAQGDIDIVNTDWPLDVVCDPSFLQLQLNLGDPLTDMQSVRVSMQRALAHLGNRALHATDCVVRGSNLRGSLCTCHLRPLQRFSFGAASDLNTEIAKPTCQHRPANTAFVGELLERGTGLIVRDKLIKVRDFEFSGHVYDLQSVSGWLVANGIVASNCRCTVVPWLERWAHDSMQSTGTEAIDAPDPKEITWRRDEKAAAK